MKISAVRVSAFRSINHAAIENCGDLNVLIGRNNSGKSNLLLAIKVFFDFLRSATLVASADPPISDLTDWFDRNESVPVTISMSMELSTEETERIREAIADQAPQMKNALNEIRNVHGIECELTFYRAPKPIGFLSRISFIEADTQSSNRKIFSLARTAAEEIASRDAEATQVSRQIQIVNNLDPDDWEVMKERRVPLASYMPRSVYAELSSDRLAAINRLIKNSESAEEFADRISVLKSELQDKKASLLGAENESNFETFSGESRVLPAYVTMIVSMIGSLKVHHLSELRQPIGQEEANRILQLKTRRGRVDVLQGIQEQVAELLGVRIDAFSSDRQPRGTTQVPAELDVDDFLVQVNGSGIREALRLILDYEFVHPNVLLVEEPEVHLHPALEIAMMEYLRKISSRCQIFLTTHSTNFLDIADLRNVYLVKRDTSTYVQHLDVEEAEEAIPQELGIRLSSLFMYDRLVFVEGPSDEQILRAFASTLGINLSRTGVGFVTTGGARNFTHYANAATLSFLSKRRVKLYFILDRDERDLPEIDKLRGQLGDLGELRVLGRRELENYLLNAAALSRYIADKGLVNPPESDDVEQLMVQATNELLEVAIERRVLKVTYKPIIPDRSAVIERREKGFVTALSEQLTESANQVSVLKEGIDAQLEEARKVLQGLRPTELLAEIPGDAIIDSIFRNYSLRFNKRKDSPKIASIMEASEIPEEIKGLLVDLST